MQIRNGNSYFLPAAFLRAAQRAFIASESFLRPAAVRPPPLREDDFVAAELPPPAFLLAAQRAFIDSESFLRPAAVSPPLLLPAALAAALLLVVPLRRAQRAFAAAASFARVAADIGRRLPRERRRERLAPPEPELPKRVDKRSSRAEICCLRESACVSF